jgi:RND family efflux transporter MFP subunit
MVLATVCAGCQQKNGNETPTVRSQQSELKTVKVVRPVNTVLKRTTTQPCTVHAYHQAELYAKVAGYLKTLNVDIGDSVSEGTELAVIHVPEMDKAREKQEATIRRLQADEKRYAASKKLAIANVSAAESMRDQAAADVNKANAQLTADESEFKRVKELAANKVVADRLRDEARNHFEASQAAKTSSIAALATAKAQVSVAQQKQAVAQAELDAAGEETNVAHKELEEMDALLAYATLRAPFNGVVTQRNIDPGDLVRNIQSTSNNASQPLFTISQLDKVRVQIAVPENDAAWANVKDAVTVTLRSMPNRPLTGKISRVSGQLAVSTRTMLVEVDLLNPDGILIPGMFGEATVFLDEKANCLMLPATAVHFDKDEFGVIQKTVFVVDSDDTVQKVKVATGLDDGKQIEITEGLTVNDRVVESMVGRLQVGQKVRVEGN